MFTIFLCKVRLHWAHVFFDKSHYYSIIIHVRKLLILYTKLYILKKLQAIHLMLYKRWCQTAKIKKYKPKLMY